MDPIGCSSKQVGQISLEVYSISEDLTAFSYSHFDQPESAMFQESAPLNPAAEPDHRRG